jgi:5-bromo-4-chloroindolyl phosphate hydrolysis protein
VKKNNVVQVVVSLFIAVLVFVFAFFMLQWSLVIAALLSIGIYTGLGFLLTPVLKIGGINIEHMKNSAEIMAILEEGERDMASIKMMMEKSKDPEIKTKTQDLYREGGKIIEYIKKNPAKAVMARRFFTYYLDKAEEILKKYHDLMSAGIETNKLKSLKEKTVSALGSISKGMVSQFSRLISSELIDIEADIKLLESTARMEDS